MTLLGKMLQLYEIKLVETEKERVKIHYIGYTVHVHLHRVKPLLGFDISQQHDQLSFVPVLADVLTFTSSFV